MARTPSPLPEPARFGLFETARTKTAVDPNRFRRGDLVAVTRGVRMSAVHSDDLLLRIAAFGLVLRSGQFLSHTTAALVWGMPLPWRHEMHEAPVHVTTVGSGAVMRRRGVVGHRQVSEHASIRLVRGVRVSDPVSTWYACRSLLSVADLIVLGDHVVGPARLATVDHLRAACRTGDRGVGVASGALARIRPGSESAMETRVRLVVVDSGFPEPELNIDVRDGEGRFLGRADMAWPEFQIALEYDGDHHRTDRDTFHGDRRRGNGFAVNGWIVIHVTSTDVREPTPMLNRLAEAFRMRGVLRG